MNKLSIGAASIAGILFLCGGIAQAQNIAINTTGAAADATAMLDVVSTNKGILIPRVSLTSTTDATTIPSPTTSLLVYNSNAGMTNGGVGFWYWDGAKWVRMSGGTGGNDWALLGNNGTVDGTNFLGTIDNVPFNFRVFNQKAGRIEGPSTSTYNTFFGYQSGNANTSGPHNTFIGYLAGSANTTADSNTFVGSYAGKNNAVGGQWNTAIGAAALYSNTSGQNNSALGQNALYSNTTGGGNVAVGNYALQKNTSGLVNTALGVSALEQNTTGWWNTAVGVQALQNNTTGGQNTSIGLNSLQHNSTGAQNTASGMDALLANTTGSFNTADGESALSGNTTGSNNTGIGFYALSSNKAGSYATAVGSSAMGNANNTTTAFANYNVAVGYEALRGSVIASANTGNNNTALGYQSLLTNSTGDFNTATGWSSLISNTTGRQNVAMGVNTLHDNTTGNQNTALGTNVLYANTTGSWNTGAGYHSLRMNTLGGSNAAYGDSSMYNNTTASWNVAIGNMALYTQSFSNTNTEWKSNNTAVGFQALYLNNPTATNNGVQNTAVGSYALSVNTIGTGNTAIGYNANVSANNLTNAAAVGANALVSASNALILGSINGINGATANTRVGIGTNAPVATLEVKGTTRLGIYTSGTLATTDGLTQAAIISEDYLSPVSNTTNATGIGSWTYFAPPAGVTISNGAMFMSCDPKANAGAGTITNGYGLYIPTVSFATNNYGAYIGGNVGIGTASPLGKLHIFGGYATSGMTSNSGLYINGRSASPNSAQFVWGDNTGWKIHFGTVSAGNFVERLTIVDQGNVGIGTTSPSEKLEVCGNLKVIGTINASGVINASQAISCSSDLRFKKNIRPLNKALDNILCLRGVNYEWRTEEFPGKQFSAGNQIGFIAQELEKVYPEIVFADKEGYKSVDYSRLTPILVEAMKEQQAMIESQQNEIAELKAMVNKIILQSANTASVK